MKLLFFVINLVLIEALMPRIPKYKQDAYELFGGRYKNKVSPFSQDRYDSARWNYVSRNIESHLSRNHGVETIAPLQHKADHLGNYLQLEFMHGGTHLLSSPLVESGEADYT